MFSFLGRGGFRFLSAFACVSVSLSLSLSIYLSIYPSISSSIALPSVFILSCWNDDKLGDLTSGDAMSQKPNE